ncbi:MAG: c-type cytochrome biogenesis protein CcmI [Rhizobacter sp.]
MGAFFFAAMSLFAVTLLMLLRPWQRHPRSDGDASIRQINVGVHRDQLAELDRDLAAGVISAADHAIAREELQRRLLDDTAVAAASSTQAARGRHTVLALAIALPLAASALYALLGEPAALLGRPAGVAGGNEAASAEIERMVAGLAARLEKNPGDMKGWAMLARSYHAMGRYPESAAAFARLGDELHKDPLLLSVYADVLASSAGGNLEGEPIRLVDEALRLDPDQPMALSLAATAAFKRNDFPEAARQWQHLLRQLPPDSDEARWVAQTLAQIGAPVTSSAVATTGTVAAAGGVANAGTSAGAGATPSAPASPGSPPTAGTRSTAGTPATAGTSATAGTPASAGTAPPAATLGAADRAVSGVVSLSPALQAGVAPTDTVFVFARATQGSRMPLAVQRARVADLPLRFRLDDSMAMSPQAKISDAKQLHIEARVSRAGTATPASGDLIGASAPVEPGASRVTVMIDRVRP